METVSIIVPVYNGEKYLRKCIDSILNQTYQAIEIILVNDGSTDQSHDLLKEYQKQNPQQIKVYNQENQGIAMTRNKGLKQATGKYVMFVDNDDYLDPEYVETFVDEIRKSKSEIVIGGFREVDDKQTILMERTYSNNPWTRFQFVTPWARIYRRSLLTKNHLSFFKTPWGEDLYFNSVATSYAKKVKVITYIGYNHLANVNSVTNTDHRKLQTDFDLIALFEKIKQDSCQKDYNMNQSYYIRFFLKSIIWYTLSSGKNEYYQDTYKEYIRLLTWLKNENPRYKSLVKWSKPVNEPFQARAVVKLMTILDSFHLTKLFFKVYTTGKKQERQDAKATDTKR